MKREDFLNKTLQWIDESKKIFRSDRNLNAKLQTPKFCLSKKPKTTTKVVILEDNSSLSGICNEESDESESSEELVGEESE